MMIITGGGISFPLSISIVAISMTISMRVAMMIISWFSISFSSSSGLSFPLSITIVSITMTISMRVSMVVISWLSITLAIAIAMVTVTTISSIAMMVISWLSYSSSKEGKGNSKQKIHLLVGLNSSETPPC